LVGPCARLQAGVRSITCGPRSGSHACVLIPHSWSHAVGVRCQCMVDMHFVVCFGPWFGSHAWHSTEHPRSYVVWSGSESLVVVFGRVFELLYYGLVRSRSGRRGECASGGGSSASRAQGRSSGASCGGSAASRARVVPMCRARLRSCVWVWV
jgi:hypothetical protein